jgi:5-methylcytosine-specific restriction endonuclease McrA
MSRSVKDWVGKTDDTQAPPRVRLRVFERCDGRCHRCGRKIRPGEKWTLEHLTAIILGGRNSEDNLGCTCEWCLPVKNAEDQSAKSKLAKITKRHIGVKENKRGFTKPPKNYNPWTRRIERAETQDHE